MTTVDHPDVPRPLPVDRLAAEDTNWGRELSSALIRVGAGVLMVHNGLDKLVDPEGFAKFVVEPYLGFLPHDDPISYVTWTYLAAGAELAGAAGLTLGLWTRLCSLSSSPPWVSPCTSTSRRPVSRGSRSASSRSTSTRMIFFFALYCLLYFYFLVNGGGVVSLDNALKKKRLMNGDADAPDG